MLTRRLYFPVNTKSAPKKVGVRLKKGLAPEMNPAPTWDTDPTLSKVCILEGIFHLLKSRLCSLVDLDENVVVDVKFSHFFMICFRL
jgi:hypothetical protein